MPKAAAAMRRAAIPTRVGGQVRGLPDWLSGNPRSICGCYESRAQLAPMQSEFRRCLRLLLNLLHP